MYQCEDEIARTLYVRTISSSHYFDFLPSVELELKRNITGLKNILLLNIISLQSGLFYSIY